MEDSLIQNKIKEIKEDFETIGISIYQDDMNQSRIKNSKHDAIIVFNNIIDIENISITIYTNSINNTISSEEIKKLVNIKNSCNKELFENIVNYIVFEKANYAFFNIIDTFISEKATVIHEMIENNEIIETENEVADSIINRNQEISNYIIEFLNKELSSFGLRKFVKNRRYYISEDNKVAVLVMRSKRYNRSAFKYWYTFHKYQKDILDKYEKSYVMLYFDDKDECILINTDKLYTTLSKLGKTLNGENIGWHLHIQEENGIYSIRVPYEGLLNIKEDGSLELHPFKKEVENLKSSTNSEEGTSEDGDKDYINPESEINTDVTIKILNDDFKVIKFKKN